MARILIVDYSLGGTTRQAAATLAEACEARQEHIEETRPRRGPLGMLRSVWEALRRTCPRIRAGGADPAEFDLVVLATPVWAGRMASPMRSWIARNGDRLGRVAFLATQGGSGAEGAFDGMEGMIGHAPVGRLVLSSSDFQSDADEDKIAKFANDLRAACGNGRTGGQGGGGP